ncbi:phosphoglycolate phosphatase [Hyphomicrobium nitrativorans NL23]|uniref:Phosphoglycolate phosphatase n=2 Tax=Hyphomicrobium TaxID=81 RepID=V5SF68_9HYPH|nr:phosphoglycolate phosphatase [Hyphomicrobium nitrativorans NL23]
MPMHNATLVFDLDGTLVDTAPDLVAATNHALADLALPPVPAETLRHAIGFGARRMIVVGLKETGVTLDEPEIDRLLARFLAYYEPNLARESRPFEGAIAALEQFRSEGARLAVCTNKRLALAEQLLAELGVRDLFAAVAGRDTFPVHKPHPGHLTGTIALAGGDKAAAVMVGDTGIDIETARTAGIPSIACTFGYSDVPVATYEPDTVIDSYADLDAAVRKLLARAPAS